MDPIAADHCNAGIGYDLNRICSRPQETAHAALLGTHGVAADIDRMVDTPSDDEYTPTDDSTMFKPIYTMVVWENYWEDRHVSVAILMPSGTCSNSKQILFRYLITG